jgi:hypothetical protein
MRINRMNWKNYGVVCGLLLAVGCGGEKGKAVSQANSENPGRLTVLMADCLVSSTLVADKLLLLCAPDGTDMRLTATPTVGTFHPY